MSMVLRHVLGSFRVLGRRAAEVGRPALSVWTETGEQAVADVSRDVSAKAHANECAERSLVDDLKAMLADGKIDAAELNRLLRAPAVLNRCVERSHDIGEIVKL